MLALVDLAKTPVLSFSRYLWKIWIFRNLEESSYVLDYHIPNLLVFPPKAQLYNHPLVEDGSLILQVQ
jgi:hypothetical protein